VVPGLRETARRPVLEAHSGELSRERLSHGQGTDDACTLEQSSEARAPVVTRPRCEEERESPLGRGRRRRSAHREHGGKK
jgi:hypothetical protein